MDLLLPEAHLSRQDFDRRIRHALLHASQCAGTKAHVLMRKALANGPSKNGAADAQAWYGDKLPAILKLCDPIIVAMNNGIPGFSQWLEQTGYGNDCAMIRALVAWTDHSTGTVEAFTDITHRADAALKRLN